MKIRYLSYQLDEKTPAYGGGTSFSRIFTKQIALGDSCNQFNFTMNNHMGTHIDAPLHFIQEGFSITDYPPDFWNIQRCGFLEYAPQPGEVIDFSQLNIQSDVDLECLLLKTGYCEQRESESYWKSGPGVSANSADFLRLTFPKLRFLGFDFISLTSFQNREEGRRAHRAFLGSSRPILVVEDMDLRHIKSAPQEMIISPLRIQGADGAPVTIFAKYERNQV